MHDKRKVEKKGGIFFLLCVRDAMHLARRFISPLFLDWVVCWALALLFIALWNIFSSSLRSGWAHESGDDEGGIS